MKAMLTLLRHLTSVKNVKNEDKMDFSKDLQGLCFAPEIPCVIFFLPSLTGLLEVHRYIC